MHTQTLTYNWSRDLADGAKTTARTKHGQEWGILALNEGNGFLDDTKHGSGKKSEIWVYNGLGFKGRHWEDEDSPESRMILFILQYRGDLHLDYIKNYALNLQ